MDINFITRRIQRLINTIFLCFVFYFLSLQQTTPYGHLIGDVKQGEYMFTVAGCQSCHTEKPAAIGAGGVEIRTPFGSFYTPNITPHPIFGIGLWSRDQFADSLRYGKNTSVGSFFPSFPYTSYTKMSDQDIISLYTYIMTLPKIAQENKNHQLDFPFSWRFATNFWRLLFFQPGTYQYNQNSDEMWNRGAYLVQAVGHCAECHSPRNFLGKIVNNMTLTGNPKDYDGSIVPNITPDSETGIGLWKEGDIVALLKFGILPNGDVVGGKMMEFVMNASSKLSDQDLQAIALYLKSLPPVYNPEALATKPEF